MNLRDLDTDAIYAERIRSLQSSHPKAHAALANWARWCRDLRGVFPVMTGPSWWDQYRPSDNEDWGEEHEVSEIRLSQSDAKAEPAEREEYEEKEAVILDERIHSPGGLSSELCRTLRIAYVYRALPESQMPKAAGCSPDGFRERLEAALVFVGRFA